MSYTNKKTFRKNLLTTAITLATISTAQAGIVRGDVDYQYFRDFAENKGQFGLNATNVEIFDKEGNSVGTMLDGIPMIDLAVGSRGTGYATLVKPQYVVSVQHNVGYQTVQFGDHSDANLDSHHYDYQVTDRHIKAPGVGINSWHRDDYHSPRLHKLVTEVAPIATADETSIHAYLDKEKYPTFVRSGSGRQMVLEKDKTEQNLTGAYGFVTGGSMLDLIEVVADSANIPGESKNTLMRIKGYDDMFNHPLGIMQKSGDSGSGVFAWDAQAKRWVYAMSVQSSTNSNSFSIVHLGYVDDNEKKAIAGEIIANAKNLIWTPAGNTSTITGGQADLVVDLADPALLERDGAKNAQGVAVNQWHRPRQNHGKTFTIHGDDNVLRLAGDVNQGAGAIYFTGNTTVEGVMDNTTWLGAGVSIDKDKTLTWKAHNPDQDRLSKLGEGTMLVQGTGKNLGSISVGEGKVVLDQRADSNGQRQAFDEVGIVSGRPTVVLNSSDQVNPDSIYFGFRGGRLDVNGNDLTFNRIQNADSGANIVNHNLSDSATINLQRTKQFASTGDVPLETNHARDYKPTGFYAQNRTDGTTDYFILKDGRTPNVARPAGKTDGPSWTYLTSGTKEDAIRAFLELKKNAPLTSRKDTFSGVLGEADTSKNGRLDVNYNPTLKDDVYVLNGGSHLNGTLAVKNGTLVLSGVPVPHAYDHLNKQEIIDDNDWIDREFTATAFNVENGVLTTGRNVGKITGDITVSGTGVAKIGYVQGDEVFTRTRTGATVGERKDYHDEVLANILAQTKVEGDINLRDTAQLRLNTQFDRHIRATADSNTLLEQQAHWTMPSNQTIGHLDGVAGSQITLNPRNLNPHNDTVTAGDSYHTLTVKGNLDGNVQFNYLTNLANQQSDKLVVEGYAAGSHTLTVKNTGNEANIDKLTLVELKNAVQSAGDVSFQLAGGYVDAGAYRYALKNDAGKEYYLSNPKRASELAKLRAEEAKKAEEEAQKARQALADAQKARQDAEEAKKRAEDALAQAQTGSGITPEQLAQVQKLADDAKKLAEQATAEKAQAEQALATARSQLDDANNAKAEAERLKAEADRQAQTARDEQTRLQTALDNANLAKQTAEQEKETAQNAQKLAEQQAQTASREKEQAEAKQREAEAKQQEAESQRTIAQNALDTANQQKQALEQQLADAIASGNSDTTSLREQLAQATAQIGEKERELNNAKTAQNQALAEKAEAERQKNDAQTALNQAQQDLTTANALKDQAINRADQAETQKQAVEQNLTTVQAQLTQAQADKETAEQKAREAETAKAQAERVQKELEQAQASQAEALKTAQETARLAEQAKQQAEDEKNRQAELARLAEIEKNRQAELAKQAEIAKQQAEDQANADKLKAEQELAKLQADKQKADDNLAKVQGDLTALQAEKTQLQTALDTVNTEKNQAQTDLATALREKQIAEDALKLAQQNGSADIAKLQDDLAKANSQVTEKTAELQNAIIAQTNLQNELNGKEQALNQVQGQLATAQAEKQASDLAKQQAENAQKLAEDEAKRQADLAKQAEDEKNRQAELARLAELAKQQAEQNLAQLQADKQKADDELQNALTAKNQAETEKNQAQTDLATALREKQIAEDALKLAQQNGSQNVADLQNQLANAQAEVREKQQALLDATKAQADAETAKQNAETARNNAEQALNDVRNQLATAQSEKQASDLAKQNAENAQKLAEDEAKRQADLAKQAETEKNRQVELARLADLAKQQAETAQKLAEDVKNQALTDLANAELAKTQAELAKTQAENAQKLADTARENAEKALQTALTDKQNAETAKTKAESDLATALREKQLAEDTLKLAQQNGNQDVVNLQNQLAQANQAVKDKELALANAETAKQNAQTAQKLAEQERDNALKSAETAELAKTQAETTLATVRQQLADLEAQKQASDLAKQQAENAQKLAEAEAKRQEELVKQAETEKERQAELARLAEADKIQAKAEADRQAQIAKSAETAQKVAELNAQNAKQAQQLAEEAKASAETARQKAEEATLVLDEANKRLQATINADATTIAQAKADLAVAQKLADERQAILVLAQTNLTHANDELAKVRQENDRIEVNLQQEKALREKAELAQSQAVLAKQQADQARLEAIDAQTKSEAQRQEAEAKLAQAEKLAEQKQAEAEQAETARLALANQLSASLAQLQSTQESLAVAEAKAQEAKARQEVAEALLASLKAQEAQRQADALAKQASQQKQADIISQYANTALSEVSATAHHLHRVSDRIDDRLHSLDGQNSGIWLQTDSEKTRHSSDQYRAYEQDSQLTQIGMDKTTAFGAGDLTLGASLNHLRYQASFDDDFTGKGQTVSGTLYGKWQHNNGFALTGDITAGRATSEVAKQARVSDVERTVGGVGLGVAKSFKVGDVDTNVHAGVKHHYLGSADYAITASDNSQAQVVQDDMNIVSYQAGADIGKTFQTATGLNIRPSVGVGYRHTDSEGKVAINNQTLTQKFANELQGQAGIVVGKESWEVKLQADFAKNDESGYHNSASFGVSWKW